jgi:hypothetical protein
MIFLSNSINNSFFGVKNNMTSKDITPGYLNGKPWKNNDETPILKNTKMPVNK